MDQCEEINDQLYTYCVYMHTNKINNKIYIGQTCQSVHRRWRNGDGYKDNPYFYNAIQKYGWDNFEHEIIASNLTVEEANKFESVLIEKLDTMNPSKGYNLQSGGANFTVSELTRQKLSEAGKNRVVSDETKQKLSISKIGDKNPMYGKRGSLNPIYGKPRSEEHKKNLSLSHKGIQAGENHPLFGKPRPEDVKIKISQSNKGKQAGEKHPMYGKHFSDDSKHKNMMSQKTRKIIMCLETGIIYNSQAEVGRELNVAPGSVSYALKHNKDINGYHFTVVNEQTN